MGVHKGESVKIGKEKLMSDLKHCPFCGGEAELLITPHVPKGNDYTPRCRDASCAGRITKKWINKETALYAWNRRTTTEGE